MALRNISIPIPEKRITYKKSKNGETINVYHVVRRYRNNKGTPASEEKAIGKVDPNREGRMIPNENFETYYPIPADVIPLSSPHAV